jgi:RNase P subunit RPR2
VNGIIYEQGGVGGIPTHVPIPHNRDRYLTKERDMTCQKCNGLLISERILEFYAHTERWKCINCGWHQQDNSQSHLPGRYSVNRGS